MEVTAKIVLYSVLSLKLFTTSTELTKSIDIRIVGGKDADITDYPYQVSLQFNGRHGCGGAILNEYYVLTAAHCTYDVTEGDLSIRVGSSYRNSGGSVYGVEKIYFHPDFDDSTFDNDVSVLKLSSPLTYGDGIKSISMASKGTVIEGNLNATATGWGLTADNGQPSDQLQVVTLPTITTENCQGYYPSDLVSERMFCAGYDQGGKDTCQGDSGGPLVISGILIGITSWGKVCAAAMNPGVYTKIPAMVDYVDGIINSKFQFVSFLRFMGDTAQ